MRDEIITSLVMEKYASESGLVKEANTRRNLEALNKVLAITTPLTLAMGAGDGAKVVKDMVSGYVTKAPMEAVDKLISSQFEADIAKRYGKKIIDGRKLYNLDKGAEAQFMRDRYPAAGEINKIRDNAHKFNQSKSLELYNSDLGNQRLEFNKKYYK